MAKPTLPQGTRDFSPETVRKRNYIFSTIKKVFALYGFQPLETPAMENLETLMGKYGDEGDKLIFRILNNGLSDPANIGKAREAFENVVSGKNDKNLTERALRYDLTIPFARYVAMNNGQLTYPFKRYQVQPVWRADKPQRGRYREFYQCDADVVGSRSLVNEVELAMIYHKVFTELKLEGYSISINSRKILTALADVCGGSDRLIDITVAIDKLDKTSVDSVLNELKKKEMLPDHLFIIEKYLRIGGENREKISALQQLLGEKANAGISELEFLLDHTTSNNIPLKIDFTLARGLNYYTGVIFEIKAPPQIKIGSIGGGGRYDDLTGLFGVPDIAGVGISFGVDRIYDVLEEMNLFPASLEKSTEVLFINEGPQHLSVALQLANQLREKNIACEVYPDTVKDDKQYKYAKKKNIPYIVFIKPENETVFVKNIQQPHQATVAYQELVDFAFQETAS